MKKFFTILTISAILTIFPALPSPGQTPGQKPDAITAVAVEFISLLAKEDFVAATRAFDANMKKLMPPDKLKQSWTGIIDQVGPYQKCLETRQIKVEQYDGVFMLCQFERTTLEVRVVLDSSGKIAGVRFIPTQKTFEYESPAYVKPDLFTEKEITVGTGEWTLPGTLTMPKGKGPFPVIILLHGSGPMDRDETVGPNKPFRDLAGGLASNGIAVLRYEKRTKQYAQRIFERKDDITVEEETLTDAAAAVQLMANTPGIDKKKIFVLGHSLSGMLVPRFAQKNKQAAGFILLSAAARPLTEVIYDQVKYLFSLDDQVSENEAEQLRQFEKMIALVNSSQLSSATPSSSLPLGIPPKYWLDLRNYDQVKEALKVTAPMLILQGERDYQTTAADFKKWKDALGKRKKVQFILYPNLNHLLMEGQGKITPAEYNQPNHVHETVIKDISRWIKSN